MKNIKKNWKRSLLSLSLTLALIMSCFWSVSVSASVEDLTTEEEMEMNDMRYQDEYDAMVENELSTASIDEMLLIWG